MKNQFTDRLPSTCTVSSLPSSVSGGSTPNRLSTDIPSAAASFAKQVIICKCYANDSYILQPMDPVLLYRLLV